MKTSDKLRERLKKGFGIDLPDSIPFYSHPGSNGSKWDMGKLFSWCSARDLLKADRLYIAYGEISISTPYLECKYEGNPDFKFEKIDNQ